MKICTKCKVEKGLTDFFKDKVKPDGYYSSCKECCKAYKQSEAYKKLKSAHDKTYVEKHRDKVRLIKSLHYYSKKDYYRNQMRANYLNKSEDYKERARQRKNLLKAGVQIPYSKQEIYERDGGLCFRCLEVVDLTLNHPSPKCFSFHHLIPIKLGGHDTPDNVVSSHLECNLRQGIKVFTLARAHQ